MNRKIKCVFIDVDGTLTDSGIYYDEDGNELKKFSTKDAAGFFAAKKVGILTVVVTGRECKATERRLKELQVDVIGQGVKDKVLFLREFISEYGVSTEEIAYIGDDLNDLPVMKVVGYVGCPYDSCTEVREIANYISEVKGGHGAVRDIIEHILRESNEWEGAVSEVYGFGI